MVCILITGSLVDYSEYKPFKVVRLSNGAYDNHSPNYIYDGANKIRKVYLDGGYMYVELGSFIKIYLEGSFNSVETIDSVPTDATELPILDLTQGNSTDLTEINTKLVQLETKQINKTSIVDMDPTPVCYKITPKDNNTFSKILIVDLYGGCLLITGSMIPDYKSLKAVRLSNGCWESYSASNNVANKIESVYYDGSYIYVNCLNYIKINFEGGFTNVEKIETLPTEVTELPVLDLTQGSGNDTRITTLETQVSDLFQSVSDGKTLVANAITDKGVSTSTTATFATMATNIGALTSCTASEKQALATAITKKGVSTSSTDSLATMATNIGKIKTNSYKKDYATATCKSNSGTSLTFRFSSTVVGIVKIEPPKSSSSFSIEDDLGISGGTVTIKVLDGYGDWEITAIVYA